MATKKPAKAE
jgi:Ran GTPase-activating protein (RanGAP) involved in mRNA processing and transport